MSMYTTGELAKLCGVTVRTVQYYDSRSILLPSRLSEGGRRLYSEDDLRKMKTICFLRSLGLSIDSIREILDEAHPEQVIALILQQQETALRSEIKANEKKLALIEDLRQGIKLAGDFSADSISDIAGTVDNRKKQPFKALFSPHAPIAQVDQKKRMEKTSQAINLTGFSGSGNVIRTHDTSGMKNQNWK